MRVLVINPTRSMQAYLKELGVDYEIVESADKMSEKFRGHDGIFHGVIAPNNPPPGTMRSISENWYTKNRCLPVFVFGSTVQVKERIQVANRDRVTFVYRQPLREGLHRWLESLLQMTD